MTIVQYSYGDQCVSKNIKMIINISKYVFYTIKFSKLFSDWEFES